MLIQNTGPKYPIALRILHWLMAVMIIGLLALGLYMAELPKGDPRHDTLYNLHKSFGVTVLALAFIRLAVRMALGAPPLPEIIPVMERRMAELGHLALYGFMFLMPVSGYVMSTSYGLSVKWFGITLPRLMGIDRARGALAGDVHSYAAYALIGMILMHAGAVILHYVRQRVNLLKRMI
jgi:cytochrome b561